MKNINLLPYSNMTKVYEFYDTFIKTCEYKNGNGECKKTRESKKCINGVCEDIKIPESKLDVLDDFYNQIKNQTGSGEHKTKFKCPGKECSFKTSKFDKFKNHVNKEHNKQYGKGVSRSKSPIPINKSLYNYVKQLANKKFKSKSGIYRSSWIVREYKKRGGRYSGKKTSSKGLKRWYKEKWVDLNRPIRNSKGKIIGYKSCGRSKIKGSKGKYPLCRPSKRINRGTPKTYQSISSKSISKAKREKSRIKHKGNIKFGGSSYSKQEGGYYGDPSIKKKLLRNLLLKRKCPVCSERIKGDMLEHLQQHEFKLPHKKRKLSLDLYMDAIKKQKQTGGSDCEMCQIGNGKKRSQYHGRRSKVMIKVPINVKNVALYSFKLKKMGFGGGIETGWKRAKQLATRDSIPIEDLKYMRAWFARHLYASYPSYKQWKKAGRPKDTKWHRKHGIISWLIWSGDAGFKWVNSKKNINLLNKHYNKNYKPIKLPK